MSTIMCLPMDVIFNILNYVDISIEDVMNFTHTCKQWRHIFDNFNFFWKKKFFWRWPSLKNIYNERMIYVKHINFEEQVKARIKCEKELWHYVSQMSEKHYHRKGLSDSDIKDFDLLFHLEKSGEHKYSMNIYFLLDELRNGITPGTSLADKLDLTQKYYAKILYSYLNRYQQRNKWQEFKNSTEQTLERAATFVSQGCQPDKFISYSRVKESLDDLAQQILELLRKKYPMHSIFSISTEQLLFWKHNNIHDNQWNIEEGHQIMNCIEDILHDFDYFFINKRNRYRMMNHELFHEDFIDYALERKRGNEIIITVIFACVARRLGISCNLEFKELSGIFRNELQFEQPTNNVFLTWKAKDLIAENSTDNKCFYFNAIESIWGRRRNHSEKYPIKNFVSCSPEINCEKVAAIMIDVSLYHTYDMTRCEIDDYKRSLLELYHLVNPNDEDKIFSLCDYYKEYGLNASDLIVALKKILVHKSDANETSSYNETRESIQQYIYNREIKRMLNKYRGVNEIGAMFLFLRPIPKRRTKQLKFLVGELVSFFLNTFRIDGAIIGWDIESYCDRDRFHTSRHVYGLVHWKEDNFYCYNSKEPYAKKMRNEPLKGFYFVISGDLNNYRTYYVAQAALKKADLQNFSPDFQKCNTIGRYFCEIKETHCVPNQMLANHYPDDFEMLRVKYT